MFLFLRLFVKTRGGGGEGNEKSFLSSREEVVSVWEREGHTEKSEGVRASRSTRLLWTHQHEAPEERRQRLTSMMDKPYYRLQKKLQVDSEALATIIGPHSEECCKRFFLFLFRFSIFFFKNLRRFLNGRHNGPTVFLRFKRSKFDFPLFHLRFLSHHQ